MRKLATISIAAALAALMALASPALASGRQARVTDRNHDRIPDSWERHFHLSLRVNQARRDPDHDGLNNLQEFRDHTNPRRADTDGDGIKDGMEMRLGLNPRSRDSNRDGVDDENELAGTIASFDGTTLTITPAGGGAPVSGTVDATTRIECETAEQDEADEAAPSTTTARASEDGDRGGSGEVENQPAENEPAENEQGENEQGDDEARTCTTADLTQGTLVHEAELENGVFAKVELVK
jgi:hypothetical protein